MKHIISIQSHVAYGHVGNCAAVFPLQRLGWDVIPVNTVQFSNHTGYPSFKGEVFSAEHVREVIQGVRERIGFKEVKALLSGYLGDRTIGDVVLETAAALRQAEPGALYCCDPVMGDPSGGCIVRPDVPEWMRKNAIPVADIITPNAHELFRLTDRTPKTLADVLECTAHLRAQGPRVVVVKSLAVEGIQPGHIGMLVATAAGAWKVEAPRLDLPPLSGMGDFTAAVFLASCLEYGLEGDAPARALARTAAAGQKVLEATLKAGGREIALIQAQDAFVAARAEDVTLDRLR